jgi:rubrerythrin
MNLDKKKMPAIDDDYGEIDNVSPSFDKKMAICNHCKYQFKANYTTRTPKNCPYCGRTFFYDI